MSTAEPLPPWVMNPGTSYEAFWMECCDPHVHSVWLPFWNKLTEEERVAYLARFPPAPGWKVFLDDLAVNREFDQIDAADIASGVLQPNGLAWPQPKAARRSLWSRLLRRY